MLGPPQDDALACQDEAVVKNLGSEFMRFMVAVPLEADCKTLGTQLSKWISVA